MKTKDVWTMYYFSAAQRNKAKVITTEYLMWAEVAQQCAEILEERGQTPPQ